MRLVTFFNRIIISVMESVINMGSVFKFRSNWNLEVLVFTRVTEVGGERLSTGSAVLPINI